MNVTVGKAIKLGFGLAIGKFAGDVIMGACGKILDGYMYNHNLYEKINMQAPNWNNPTRDKCRSGEAVPVDKTIGFKVK